MYYISFILYTGSYCCYLLLLRYTSRNRKCSCLEKVGQPYTILHIESTNVLNNNDLHVAIYSLDYKHLLRLLHLCTFLAVYIRFIPLSIKSSLLSLYLFNVSYDSYTFRNVFTWYHDHSQIPGVVNFILIVSIKFYLFCSVKLCCIS